MLREAKLQILAIMLIGVGLFQLVHGLSYADSAKREATIAGTISRADCGRTCTYLYVFKVNGVKIEDQTDTCRTALSNQRCKVGAPVLVYYDTENISESLLEDFGVAGRGRIFFGVWMVASGLLLSGLKFILERKERKSAESEGQDESEHDGEPDALHIVAKD